jgi:hypothetical protein
MVAQSIRANVVDAAHRDAAEFFREFHRAVGLEQRELDWVAEAWADLTHDLDLRPDDAGRLWSSYWTEFSEETVKLASLRMVGE